MVRPLAPAPPRVQGVPIRRATFHINSGITPAVAQKATGAVTPVAALADCHVKRVERKARDVDFGGILHGSLRYGADKATGLDDFR